MVTEVQKELFADIKQSQLSFLAASLRCYDGRNSHGVASPSF